MTSTDLRKTCRAALNPMSSTTGAFLKALRVRFADYDLLTTIFILIFADAKTLRIAPEFVVDVELEKVPTTAHRASIAGDNNPNIPKSFLSSILLLAVQVTVQAEFLIHSTLLN